MNANRNTREELREKALLRLTLAGAILVATLGAVSLAGCNESSTDDFTAASVPRSCTPQANISGCGTGQSGYSCAGDQAPDDGDPNLVCTRGTPGVAALEGGADGGPPSLYCCITYAQMYSYCTVDRTQASCGSEAYGFSCTGAVSPEQADPFLSCSDPTPGDGGTLYCCVAEAPPAACEPDDSVPGCTNSEIGFACAGSASPAQTGAAVSCGQGTKSDAGRTVYCCATE
jgi:hypothetical protein